MANAEIRNVRFISAELIDASDLADYLTNATDSEQVCSASEKCALLKIDHESLNIKFTDRDDLLVPLSTIVEVKASVVWCCVVSQDPSISTDGDCLCYCFRLDSNAQLLEICLILAYALAARLSRSDALAASKRRPLAAPSSSSLSSSTSSSPSTAGARLAGRATALQKSDESIDNGYTSLADSAESHVFADGRVDNSNQCNSIYISAVSQPSSGETTPSSTSPVCSFDQLIQGQMEYRGRQCHQAVSQQQRHLNEQLQQISRSSVVERLEEARQRKHQRNSLGQLLPTKPSPTTSSPKQMPVSQMNADHSRVERIKTKPSQIPVARSKVVEDKKSPRRDRLASGRLGAAAAGAMSFSTTHLEDVGRDNGQPSSAAFERAGHGRRSVPRSAGSSSTSTRKGASSATFGSFGASFIRALSASAQSLVSGGSSVGDKSRQRRPSTTSTGSFGFADSVVQRRRSSTATSSKPPEARAVWNLESSLDMPTSSLMMHLSRLFLTQPPNGSVGPAALAHSSGSAGADQQPSKVESASAVVGLSQQRRGAIANKLAKSKHMSPVNIFKEIIDQCYTGSNSDTISSWMLVPSSSAPASPTMTNTSADGLANSPAPSPMSYPAQMVGVSPTQPSTSFAAASPSSPGTSPLAQQSFSAQTPQFADSPKLFITDPYLTAMTSLNCPLGHCSPGQVGASRIRSPSVDSGHSASMTVSSSDSFSEDLVRVASGASEQQNHALLPSCRPPPTGPSSSGRSGQLYSAGSSSSQATSQGVFSGQEETASPTFSYQMVPPNCEEMRGRPLPELPSESDGRTHDRAAGNEVDCSNCYANSVAPSYGPLHETSPAGSQSVTTSATVATSPTSNNMVPSAGRGPAVTGGQFRNNLTESTEASSTTPSCPRCQERQAKNETNHQINNFATQLRKESWYLGRASREQALQLLAKKDIGSFIVRDSASQAGCFALSVKVPRFDNPTGIAHYLIEPSSRGVRLKGLDKEWPSVGSLVLHHSFMPEMLSCVLKMPADGSTSKSQSDRLCRSTSPDGLAKSEAWSQRHESAHGSPAALSPASKSDLTGYGDSTTPRSYQRLVDCS